MLNIKGNIDDMTRKMIQMIHLVSECINYRSDCIKLATNVQRWWKGFKHAIDKAGIDIQWEIERTMKMFQCVLEDAEHIIQQHKHWLYGYKILSENFKFLVCP